MKHFSGIVDLGNKTYLDFGNINPIFTVKNNTTK